MSINATKQMANDIKTAVKIRNMNQLHTLLGAWTPSQESKQIESAVWREGHTGQMQWGAIGRCDNCGTPYSINTVWVTSGISMVGYAKLDIEECTINPEEDTEGYGLCTFCPPLPVKKATKITTPAAPVAAPVDPIREVKSGDNVTIPTIPEKGLGIITRLYYVDKNGRIMLAAGKNTFTMCDVFFTNLSETMQFPVSLVLYKDTSSARNTSAARILSAVIAPVKASEKYDSMADQLFDAAVESLIRTARSSDKTGYPYAVGILKTILRNINHDSLNTAEQCNLLKDLTSMETVIKQENTAGK
jgi:hypothetical protein